MNHKYGLEAMMVDDDSAPGLDEITLEAATTLLTKLVGVDPEVSKTQPANAVKQGLEWLPEGRLRTRKQEGVVRAVRRLFREIPEDHEQRPELFDALTDAAERANLYDD